ncbi:fimbrial biogenesis outer membrane usher protein [Burkholderia sp. Bp9017]|uniref:Fimbrial biogenesis outer membrane usher protein n=1 Tax=Burkholderia anthina TaxID=179879 RepID=A0A7T7AJL9_9BURK|nr:MULTISPECIES: fimbria/pilus outer membrane usher protein [Burkholderia]MBY4864994.1 fimbrial biogenesis outer membrane usher protein [Burkholderia anthina]QQK04968.1 fimbrial biogenesis outer membrane usher protein [Burkholderia anthina]RQZ25406.1 fimbrial biogenesis outer membrane usher protein [Burkholderia sp. Bp9017]RQZ33367.1 fimbrial biogenesis outer membrane usher protein [Burkholderia sp. Bp9016]
MITTRPSRHDAADMPRIKPVHLLVAACVGAWSSDGRATTSSAADAALAQVEFDGAFMQHRLGKHFDVSRFARRNVTAPGVYTADIHVGSDWIGRYDVRFVAAPDSGDARPCFDRTLLERVGIDFGKLAPEVVAELDGEHACLRLEQAVPGAGAAFDFTRQTLRLSIPQALLARKARGYVSPDQWTAGETVGLLGYNFNLYTSKANGHTAQTQGYLGLNGGVNLGTWRFRHEGSYSWSSRGQSRYQGIATYVQRDLPSLSSQLVIGESYTSGELFDSTQFRGVRLSTDDRMLPDSLRGYAPVVRGIANSNAKVTIRQNDVTIYETTVAPGNFEIDDLYPTGYGGDLQVSVEEADGAVHTFSVPYAAVPMSLRPGIGRYSFVAGTLRNPHGSSQPLFTQATYQRGLTNLLTAYGGVTLATGYASAMLGGAFNTSFGAFGADLTHAMTSLPGAKRYNGSSIRVSYAKSVEATGTDVALAAYRYSTDGYFGLNDAMQARDAVRDGQSIDSVWRQRHRASLALTQRLGATGGRINATASAVNYWNRAGSDVNYSIGYTNRFRNVSYSLTATRQRNAGGDMGTLYYASVTIPFGREHPMTATGNVSRDALGRARLQSTLSGSLGDDHALSYSVSANHASGPDAVTDGSASVTYRTRMAEVNASAGAGTDFQQGSLGVRGALVAHRGGITFSQPVSETFAIVEAPGAAGARITNAAGVKVDGNGYAVVPYLTPYSLNTVALDPKGISMDVELKETSRQIAPRAGAVPLIRFATNTGRAALVRAPQVDGTPLPFGAVVRDETGKEVGVVAQASKVFARGLSERGSLTVQWGDDGRSVCRIAYELPVAKRHRRSPGIQTVTSVCQADSITADTQ